MLHFRAYNALPRFPDVAKEKLYVKHEVFHPYTEDETAWNSQDETIGLLAFQLQ